MRKTNAEAEETCDTSDILLWALFANRKELAEIFWIKGEDHLCKFAFRIHKTYINYMYFPYVVYLENVS